MLQPAFEDIVAARKFIAPYLPKTPLIRVNAISELLEPPLERFAALINA